MQGRRRLLRLIGPVAVVGLASAALASAGVGWGTAIPVPGIAALTPGGGSSAESISCASAGNCAVGGSYWDSNGNEQAFVADETNGTWGDVRSVPGTGLYPEGAWVKAISCASPGNCAAGGVFAAGPEDPNKLIDRQAFVVDETNGVWGYAIQLPLAGGPHGPNAAVTSISCGSAGNCVAGGYYEDTGNYEAFVVAEKNGAWGKPRTVPGDGVTSVSCASAGNCSAVGTVFVVDEKHGKWGKARKVRGITGSFVRNVSCPTAGNCVAAGSYSVPGGSRPFVVSEKHWVWGKATKVRDTAALKLGKYSWLESISCAGSADCAAGGAYTNGPHQAAFVLTEERGVWGRPVSVAGTAGDAGISSVSCGSAGNCAAVGDYDDDHLHAFLVAERSGVWQTAVVVPGSSALGDARAALISCARSGACAIGGGYTDSSSRPQAFVTAP